MTSTEKNTEPLETSPVGVRLKKRREEKGLTVADVVEATRISATNVRALEAQDYTALPADTFIRGYLQLYAKLLELDEQELITAFLDDESRAEPGYQRGKNLNNPMLSPKKMAEPTHISSASVASILLVLIVVSFTAFCLYNSWNPFAFLTGSSEDPQGVVSETFDTGENKGGDEPVKLTTYLLTAQFNRAVTVTITLDDLQPSQIEYSAGDTASWTALKHMQVEFDREDAATLTINGSPLSFPGRQDGRLIIRLPEDLPPQ
ncbi:MAG: hypothetical protein CSA34_00495 [Desulfobulbus propionicus]|nr:MAG: hypothetical protein CSA34_00495 [Desulfobulbus propionicus]